jgi:NAD(P)H-hydrate epimerase
MASATPITARWLVDHLPDRSDRAHKGTFGSVLVVAGSFSYPGAALLSGLGAMRAGAGLVEVAIGESIVGHLAAGVPELTWLPLDEEGRGLVAPSGWRTIAAAAADRDALVVGPGLGRQPAGQRRARQLIEAVHRPCVVDADGLNALATVPRWWEGVRGSLVLTPHPGEFARLTGTEVMDPGDDEGRATAAAVAAARFRQVVVLKGAATVIAAPDGRTMASAIATPALATAGSGDVLAGAIGALLAAGVQPFEAAVCGVALHGTAGMLAEARIGRAGVLARDIAALLPAAATRLRTPEPEDR